MPDLFGEGAAPARTYGRSGGGGDSSSLTKRLNRAAALLGPAAPLAIANEFRKGGLGGVGSFAAGGAGDIAKTTLTALDVPRRFTALAALGIDNAIGGNEVGFKDGFRRAVMQGESTFDLLGVKAFKGTGLASALGNTALTFAGDIATDPLTYFGVGLIDDAAKTTGLFSKVRRLQTGRVEALNLLEKLGSEGASKSEAIQGLMHTLVAEGHGKALSRYGVEYADNVGRPVLSVGLPFAPKYGIRGSEGIAAGVLKAVGGPKGSILRALNPEQIALADDPARTLFTNIAGHANEAARMAEDVANGIPLKDWRLAKAEPAVTRRGIKIPGTHANLEFGQRGARMAQAALEALDNPGDEQKASKFLFEALAAGEKTKVAAKTTVRQQLFDSIWGDDKNGFGYLVKALRDRPAGGAEPLNEALQYVENFFRNAAGKGKMGHQLQKEFFNDLHQLALDDEDLITAVFHTAAGAEKEALSAFSTAKGVPASDLGRRVKEFMIGKPGIYDSTGELARGGIDSVGRYDVGRLGDGGGFFTTLQKRVSAFENEAARAEAARFPGLINAVQGRYSVIGEALRGGFDDTMKQLGVSEVLVNNEAFVKVMKDAGLVHDGTPLEDLGVAITKSSQRLQNVLDKMARLEEEISTYRSDYHRATGSNPTAVTKNIGPEITRRTGDLKTYASVRKGVEGTLEHLADQARLALDDLPAPVRERSRTLWKQLGTDTAIGVPKSARAKSLATAQRMVHERDLEWAARSMGILANEAVEGLKGQFVDADAARYLGSLLGKQDNAKAALRSVAGITSYMRSALLLSPFFPGRNFITGVIANSSEGATLKWVRRVAREYHARPSQWSTHFREFMEMNPMHDPSLAARLGSRDASTSLYTGKVRRFMQNLSQAYEAVSVPRLIGLGPKQAKAEIRHMLANGLDDAIKVETMNRASLYMKLRADGLGREASMLRVNQLHVDYSDVSALDISIRNFVPFWMFQSRNIPAQLQGFARHSFGSQLEAFRSRQDQSQLPPFASRMGLLDLGNGYQLSLGGLNPATNFLTNRPGTPEGQFLGFFGQFFEGINPVFQTPDNIADGSNRGGRFGLPELALSFAPQVRSVVSLAPGLLPDNPEDGGFESRLLGALPSKEDRISILGNLLTQLVAGTPVRSYTN